MITFLPYSDFVKSADCLDWQWSANRLNNQVNEFIIAEKTLLGIYEKEGKKGWVNHPAVLMWKGCELSLLEYGEACLSTWMRKKKIETDSRQNVIAELQMEILNNCWWAYHRTDTGKYETNHPWWLGDERLHSSHRSILLAKNWDWYKQFGWKEEPAVKDPVTLRWPYFWPTKEVENGT